MTRFEILDLVDEMVDRYLKENPMEPITYDLTGCARCHGEGHPDITFEPLDHPVVHKDETIATHWALCPTNGQPIFMRRERAGETVLD